MRAFLGLALGGLLCGLMAATAAQADDVWRWTDSSGQVHYADQPLSASAVNLGDKNPKSFGAKSPTPAASPKRAEASAPASAASAPAAFSRVNEQEAKQACDQATEAVQQFSIGGRIAAVDASGARVVLTDEQVAQRLAQAKAAQQRWCGQGQ
jgi:hypothetical protein